MVISYSWKGRHQRNWSLTFVGSILYHGDLRALADGRECLPLFSGLNKSKHWPYFSTKCRVRQTPVLFSPFFVGRKSIEISSSSYYIFHREAHRRYSGVTLCGSMPRPADRGETGSRKRINIWNRLCHFTVLKGKAPPWWALFADGSLAQKKTFHLVGMSSMHDLRNPPQTCFNCRAYIFNPPRYRAERGVFVGCCHTLAGNEAFCGFLHFKLTRM